MSEPISEKAAEKQKRAAIEHFFGSFMPSAKMMGLYQDGHPNIMQICDRMTNVLIKTLGQENTLVADVKGKSILIGEAALTETKDINLFASTLHTLGIGQVLFTNRLTKEGMYDFLKILHLRPDEKNTLTMIQQELQKTRIDGLQMSFVLSFVATGETTEELQKPGELTEEQVQAFIRAETLPDFLLFLLKQCEPLLGKEAESVTVLLDNTLNRDVSLEQFQEAMPWSYYDQRIRDSWDEFMQKQNWTPKRQVTGSEGPVLNRVEGSDMVVSPPNQVEGPVLSVVEGDGQSSRQKWDKKSVISEISLFGNADLSAIKDRTIHEKSTAVNHCLNEVVTVLENTQTSEQSNVAMNAYSRLLTELGHDGNISLLLGEIRRWQTPLSSGEPRPQFAMIVNLLEKKVLSPILMENIALYMTQLDENSAEFGELENFVYYLGISAIPLLIEELRKLSDQQSRKKLCTVLRDVCKSIGNLKPLADALKDEDWLVVRSMVMILGEINFPGTASVMAPLLEHQHQKVREEVIRTMGNIGDESCITTLGKFILKGEKQEEVSLAITTISLLVQTGVDKWLIEAYRKTGQSDTRLAIVTALSRVAGKESENFLEALSKRNLWEVITGRNKVLSRTANESLQSVRRMLKG